MQAPRRVAGLADEIDAAPGHVRRLGILLAHPRRLPRMAHRPARGQGVALAVGGVGPIVPRVLAVIALVVEIAVVARPPRRIARAVGAHAVQTVVALVGLKAAFGYSHADDRI